MPAPSLTPQATSWRRLFERCASRLPVAEPEMLAAQARRQIEGGLRQQLAAQLGFAWNEQPADAELAELLPTVPPADWPAWLADVQQQLLRYELAYDDAGRVVARHSTSARRAAGVYYTPTVAVDYMVRRALGPLLARTTSDEQAEQPLRLLDPACGSGQFLVGALRYLISWYAEKLGRDLTATEGTELAARHLYGVDLDAEAVALARFCIALVCHEEGDGSTTTAALDLSANVVDGDALLGPDFADESSGDEAGIHWQTQFPAAYAAGGFDLVIANPPYRRELGHAAAMDRIAATSLGQFRAPRMDLWYYFTHRGLRLLRDTGRLALVTGAYWTAARSAARMRQALLAETAIDELFLLGTLPLFPGVAGRHAMLFATKGPPAAQLLVRKLDDATAPLDLVFADTCDSVHEQMLPAADVFPAESKSTVRGHDSLCHLGELGEIRQGIAENPGVINRRTNRKFGERWQVGQGVFSLSADEVAALSLTTAEQALLRPYCQLSDLGRYRLDAATRRLIYSTRETWPQLRDHSQLAAHLERFRPVMEARRETRLGRNTWWQLHWPREPRLWEAAKLLCVQMAARPSFVPAVEPTYVPFSVNVFVPHADTTEHLYYFAALLNSSRLRAWFERHAKHRGVGLDINGHVLRQAPIRRIDPTNAADRTAHDLLVESVGRRLAARDEDEVAQCEQAIDRQVEDLYPRTVDDYTFSPQGD